MTEVALVTGCGGGIGTAIVQRFQDHGIHTIGMDRSKPKHLPDDFIRCDLTKVANSTLELTSLKSTLNDMLGDRGLSVLVNNAAVQIVEKFEDLSLQQVRDSFDVNVIAPFMLSQICFEFLRASAGAIINVGSIHSKLTKPGFTAYATTKCALEGFTRALAVEIGNEVRVNAIMLAAIETAMLVDGFGGDSFSLSSLESHHPVRRLGSAAEVAELIYGLVSMQLPFLNGSIIDLSGGISSRLHDPG